MIAGCLSRQDRKGERNVDPLDCRKLVMNENPDFFKTRVPVPTRVLRRITRVFPVPQKNLTENAPKAPKFEFSIKHSMKNTKFKLDENNFIHWILS